MVSPERRTIEPDPRPGVLLLAYGGPDSLADVECYLRDVRGGRETPKALVEEVSARYAAIGGGSPLLQRTREQAAALRSALAEIGDPRDVCIGMRHWSPRIGDTVQEMASRGVRRLTTICLAPHYSRMSIGAYKRALEEALESCEETIDTTFVDHWGDHPQLIAALTETILERLRIVDLDRDELTFVFTAHSLPARIVEEGDPYADELRRTARAIASKLGLENFHFAYQSAGARAVPWLGPDLLEVLEELARQGEKHVMVTPVGFVSDHVEILYDIDIEARRRAEELGLKLHRPSALNSDPTFISALVDIVRNPERWIRK